MPHTIMLFLLLLPVSLFSQGSISPSYVDTHIQLAARGGTCGLISLELKSGILEPCILIATRFSPYNKKETVLGSVRLQPGKVLFAKYDWAGLHPTDYYRIYCVSVKSDQKKLKKDRYLSCRETLILQSLHHNVLCTSIDNKYYAPLHMSYNVRGIITIGAGILTAAILAVLWKKYFYVNKKALANDLKMERELINEWYIAFNDPNNSDQWEDHGNKYIFKDLIDHKLLLRVSNRGASQRELNFFHDIEYNAPSNMRSTTLDDLRTSPSARKQHSLTPQQIQERLNNVKKVYDYITDSINKLEKELDLPPT